MIADHARTRLQDLANTAAAAIAQCMPDIERAAQLVRDTVGRGGTLMFCGNGGSAADAQHMATEYVVRYMKNRRALAAIALTTDTSLLTAVGNDLGFDHVFSRQIEALGKPGDLLVIHSTSGNSPNCLLAARAARAKGMLVVTLSSRDGGKLKAMSDVCIVVPTDRTDRAQEVHLCIEHLICELVEEDIA